MTRGAGRGAVSVAVSALALCGCASPGASRDECHLNNTSGRLITKSYAYNTSHHREAVSGIKVGDVVRLNSAFSRSLTFVDVAVRGRPVVCGVSHQRDLVNGVSVLARAPGTTRVVVTASANGWPPRQQMTYEIRVG